MKQTAKRILSLVLSLLMVVSMMSVFASAANNYVPDEEYYDRITLDAYVVNPLWATLTDADHLKAQITYTYRGEKVTELYDKACHFATIQDAYDQSVEDKIDNPVILLTPGDYTQSTVIKGNATFIGANAGISPFVKGNEKTDPWEINPARPTNEATLAAVIFVDKAVKTNVEVKFDGLELFKGFAFIEAGARKTNTTVECINTVINGAGNASYGTYAATDVFSFSNAASIVTTLNISDTYVKNLKTSSVAGKGLSVLNANNVFQTMSQTAFLGNADGPKDQNPVYTISDSMFYNNQANFGVISVDPSANETASRTSTLLEVYDCMFIDGPDTPTDEMSKNVSPINAALTSPKNQIKVHDNWFEGNKNYNASIIGLTLGGTALTNEFVSSLTFNDNVLIGYYNVPNTTGMVSTSVIDYTGNFFADYERKQIDPQYVYEASYNNVRIDYFYVNQARTIPSTVFQIKSFGIAGASINHTLGTVNVILDYGKKYKLNIEKNDPQTVFTLYDADKKVVTELDTTKLESGVEKNKFYAVATSPKYPSYSFTYEVTVSTYDPATSVKFNKKNTYLISDEIASYKAGASYYNMWDGILYEFVVGKTAFVSIDEVFAACKETPTVIIPAGEYTQPISVVRSANIIGAKHGIDPNIKQFTDPDTAWKINSERTSLDEETYLKNTVIAVEPEGDSLVLVVDGLVFGEKSGLADTTKKENSYTTVSVENCISDNAGGGSYFSKADNNTALINTIFSVGSQDETKSHKTFRLINFRMEEHLSTIALTGYFENLLLEGCFFGNNGNFLFSNEITAPKGLNFNFEMYDNFCYKNSPSNYYFTINQNATLSKDREFSRITWDNNIFYDTTGSGAGIIGVRFASDRDFFRVTNNIFYDPSATHYIPGSENWFIGSVGVKATEVGNGLDHLEVLGKENIYVKYNRFLGTIVNSYSNMTYTNEKSYWDLTDNYYSKTYNKSNEGIEPVLGDTRHHCDSYFKDWDMTVPSKPSETFNTELSYEFKGADTAAKTFKTIVNSSVDTYEFDIDVITRQAKYNIYTDEACTNEVANPVTLGGGDNVYYIKFSSYDGTVTETYVATVTKPASTGALVESFGNWKISGKSIFASVPVGTSTFILPTPKVSLGATYAIYTDEACTNAVTSNVVDVPAGYPVLRYIKVVSQDLKTTNIYRVSIIQAANDQAELIAIKGAEKINDTTFKASIEASSFDIYATISDGATITATVGGRKIGQNADGSITIDSIIDKKTVVLTVTSQEGPSNTFTLDIIKGVSSSGIESIFNMYARRGDKSSFETLIYDMTFKVEPTLSSDAATWELYEDSACTKKISGDTLILRSYTTVAYLKITSPDKTSTNVVTLTVKSQNYKDDAGVQVSQVFSVKDAVKVEGTKNNYVINLPAGTNKYTFELIASEAGYEKSNHHVAGDPDYAYRYVSSVPVTQKTEVALTGRNNMFYIKIWVLKGEVQVGTEEFWVTVVSPRTTVATYKDASKISSWAKKEVDYLNKNGFAYFVGDDNGNFNPSASINRFEAAVVIGRMLGIDKKTYMGKKTLFSDKVPAYADPYVKFVYATGIMNGKSTTFFDGYAGTTREEFAKIISGAIAFSRGEGSVDDVYNANKAVVDFEYQAFNFADESKISGWAKNSIKLATAYYKVMNGANENGKLYAHPKQQITREEVAILIANYSGYTK